MAKADTLNFLNAVPTDEIADNTGLAAVSLEIAPACFPQVNDLLVKFVTDKGLKATLNRKQITKGGKVADGTAMVPLAIKVDRAGSISCYATGKVYAVGVFTDETLVNALKALKAPARKPATK